MRVLDTPQVQAYLPFRGKRVFKKPIRTCQRVTASRGLDQCRARERGGRVRVGGCAERSKIAAAVLDVTEKEPLPEDHPFWTMPNLLLTFHTSAISYLEDITKLFIENYRHYIEGKPLGVDPPLRLESMS